RRPCFDDRMIPDRDVWQAAVLLGKRYGDDAMLEAAERADQLLDERDLAGAEDLERYRSSARASRLVASGSGAVTWSWASPASSAIIEIGSRGAIHITFQ